MGVWLSGAGSTIIALCLEQTQRIADVMVEAGLKLGVPGRGIVVPLASDGASAELSHPPRSRRKRPAADHW